MDFFTVSSQTKEYLMNEITFKQFRSMLLSTCIIYSVFFVYVPAIDLILKSKPIYVELPAGGILFYMITLTSYVFLSLYNYYYAYINSKNKLS